MAREYLLDEGRSGSRQADDDDGDADVRAYARHAVDEHGQRRVEPPPRLGVVEREYVSGVGKLGDRLLILLDTDRLMTETEPEMLSAAAAQA